MQRYPLKFRQNVYTEGDFYSLIPVARRQVAPGERFSRIMCDIRFSSAVYDKANLTPVLAQAWAFYVPHRLVWDQWVDFIALDDTVTTVPTSTDPAPEYLEPGSGSRSALFRRAYKKVYNQYFGDESQVADGAWFANEADDTSSALGRLLIWDQYRSHARAGAYTQNTYTAAVSGATATIQLDDLSRALRDNNARRRQKMTGDKYVDTMRLMGVELDWRVQMAPEFLGASQQVLHGSLVQSAATDLTKRATSFDGQHQLMIKRPLAFAEHGYVMVLVGFRPLVPQPAQNTPDSSMTTQNQFYRPDLASGPTVTGTNILERNAIYLKGRNTTGVNNNANGFFDTGSINSLYPNPAMFVPATGSGPNAMAMVVDFAVSGLTPIKGLVA